MIFYIILFLIILAIVVWGGATQWRFISKNKEGFSDTTIARAVKLLHEGVEESDEYSALGNKLSGYFIDRNYWSKLPAGVGQGWCGCSSTGDCTNSKIEEYIENINKALPKINKELSKIEPNLNLKNDAIIHIRAQAAPPAPGERHPAYHWQPKAYYKWVADYLKKANIKKIHFLMCPQSDYGKISKKKDHRNEKYYKIIKDWIKEFLPNIEIIPVKCLGISSTFKNCLGCKVLVQGGFSPSSFLFFPGLTKGKNFLTPRFGKELDKNTAKKSNKLIKDYIDKFPWRMWGGDPIFHAEVDNYDTFDYKNYRKN